MIRISRARTQHWNPNVFEMMWQCTYVYGNNNNTNNPGAIMAFTPTAIPNRCGTYNIVLARRAEMDWVRSVCVWFGAHVCTNSELFALQLATTTKWKTPKTGETRNTNDRRKTQLKYIYCCILRCLWNLVCHIANSERGSQQLGVWQTERRWNV